MKVWSRILDLIEDVLQFWFGDADPDGAGDYREAWFKADPDFDAEIATRFADSVAAAAKGAHDAMAETPAGSLALCILLDQFPRNLFRGRSEAFATDAKARKIAAAALNAGHDQALSVVKRAFLYLPFEHSEDLEDQARSVELFRALGNDLQYRYALEHYYVISRFRRFPTRNAALGRQNTVAEAEFLASFDAF